MKTTTLVERLREAWKYASENSLLISEAADTIEQLHEQLAASQAREAKLREALEKLVRFNSSNEYTEVLSAYIANGREALALPAVTLDDLKGEAQ